MLTSEQIAQYHEKGWLTVNDVYGDEETDRIIEVAMRVSDEELAQGKFGKVDRSASGEVLPRKVDTPFKRAAAFRSFVLDERLVSLVRQLLGDEALLIVDQIFMKPPRIGSEKPYHQDNFYFKLTPNDKGLTAWIALDDVDEENGCLRYIDGSHHDGIIAHWPIEGEEYNLAPREAEIDYSRESLAPVRKGGVVFHHLETLHRSGRNESTRWRRAYASHWAAPQVSTTSGILDNAYQKPQPADAT